MLHDAGPYVGATAGSALAVAALFVCLWGPVVALGGIAGRIVDTHENRRLLFFTISVTAEVFFATEVLGTGATGYGLLMTSWTLGMVAGAVGLARLVPAPWLAVGALAGVAVQGAGLLGAAVGATMASALAGFLVGGVAHGAKNVLLRTLIHERVPEASRGRAFATYNAARNRAELAALGAGGVLVGLAGSQIALAVSGAVPLAIGAVTLLVITAPAPWRRTAYA